MNAIRNLLAIIGGGSAGVAIIALMFLGPTVFGVALAICAAAVMAWGYLAFTDESARQRELVRAYREDVWERRISDDEVPR